MTYTVRKLAKMPEFIAAAIQVFAAGKMSE